MSKELKHDEITDILQSKTNKELDPLLPAFKDWLAALSASEYLGAFVEAGYDLKFIATEGLTEDDLDCCGIPAEKRGLRRKLVKLHKLDEFYEEEEEEDDDEDDDDDDEDDDEEDDEEEEEEDDEE
jgi:cobalamin biosynthesis protein CobT